MTSTSEAMTDPSLNPKAGAHVPAAPTRPFYWSLRRELWENRSIYIAPIATAAVILLGFLMGMTHIAGHLHQVSELDAPNQLAALVAPYRVAALLVIVVSLIVAVFYCLDALYGERRDRTVLFWKSLPVSDLTAVLAKASVPMVLLPVISIVTIVAMEAIMWVMSLAMLIAHHMDTGMLFSQLPLGELWLVFLYAILANTLWYAPIYGYLLLVSAWAPRSTFLWALLSPLALAVVVRIAFRSSYLFELLHSRIAGGFSSPFEDGSLFAMTDDPIPRIDLSGFLASPGLWIGLVVAAGLFAAVVWLRRNRDPL